ncbi:MAG: hypothetical protein ACRETL_12625, partial [Gammaproteobacteria bacterium]
MATPFSLNDREFSAAVAAIGQGGASSAGIDTTPESLRGMFLYDVKASAIGLVKLLSCYNAASIPSGFRLPANLAVVAPDYPSSFSEIEGSGLHRGLT